MKTIVITVSPQGETQLETTGFAGSECKEASQFLESALGTSTGERLTAEYHQAVSAEETQLRQRS